jgi:cytochrome c-type biogenesis protein CcmH/NrfF
MRKLVALAGALSLMAAAPRPLAAQASEAADSAAIANEIRTPPGDSVGRLAYPEAAGRLVRPVTAADNSALVRDIEEKIRCTCGCNLSVYTCRTTDFECTVSPAMHQVVLKRLEAGMTEAQVLASFQKQYGDMIFMEPPKHGFNLLAYIMPFLGLAIGLGLVGGVVRRWSPGRDGEAAADVAPGAAPAGTVAPEDLERLKRELDNFEA